MEGAEGPYDTTPLASFPAGKTKEEMVIPEEHDEYILVPEICDTDVLPELIRKRKFRGYATDRQFGKLCTDILPVSH